MCGIETYLDLTETPLIEAYKLDDNIKQALKEVVKEEIKELNTNNVRKLSNAKKRIRKLKRNNLCINDDNRNEFKKELSRLENQNRDLKKQLKEYKNTKPVPNSVRKAVFERDNYTCQCCNTKKDLTIDHIVPRSKGGSNDETNLQTLCKSCNLAKADLYVNYRNISPLMVKEAK
ncbi:HNH endonuclease [Methanobrevibacter arboriphilus]|uniref:HNH endonuclease n=1 Tax=Methanobrevibacter arboriphilus TaxID=39441 RepID=UPI00241ED9A4|nr:HNH endonuclease [Methanobrevibacter arboriphilus]